MQWTKPDFEEISLGMEVTAYVNTDDRQQRPEEARRAETVATAAEPRDATAGLLLVREGNISRVFCTPVVRRWLNRFFPVEPVLARFAGPAWEELPLDTPRELPLPDGTPSGLQICAFEADRHAPRFVAEEQ